MFEVFAQQGVELSPVVRLDIDDLADFVALAYLWWRVNAGPTRDKLLRKITTEKAVLKTDPKTHEVEVAEGTGPVRIILQNGTVRVERLNNGDPPE